VTDREIIDLLKAAFESVGGGRDAAGKLSMASSLPDLGIDSIAALRMAAYVEERLKVRFPDDELAGVNTIADLARLVRTHGTGKGASDERVERTA
jgi:acyl carrier protein